MKLKTSFTGNASTPMEKAPEASATDPVVVPSTMMVVPISGFSVSPSSILPVTTVD
jgi:hypothetical protein